MAINVSSDAGLAGLGQGIFVLYSYSCLSNSLYYFTGGDVATSASRGRIRKGFAKDSGSNLAVDQNSANPDTTRQLARR